MTPEMEARLRQSYKPGDKVRVLSGKHKGQILTVRYSDEVMVSLVEMPKREILSKGVVEKLE